MQSGSITITAAGTPQSLARATSPSLPTISTQGLTSTISGAMEFGQVTVQNPVGATGNVYVGTPGMTKLTALSLAPGQYVTLGNGKSWVILDQIWIDADNAAQKATFFAV